MIKTYTVEIERDSDTRIITHEVWHRGGELDGMDGPAVIRRDPTTGMVVYEV